MGSTWFKVSRRATLRVIVIVASAVALGACGGVRGSTAGTAPVAAAPVTSASTGAAPVNSATAFALGTDLYVKVLAALMTGELGISNAQSHLVKGAVACTNGIDHGAAFVAGSPFPKCAEDVYGRSRIREEIDSAVKSVSGLVSRVPAGPCKQALGTYRRALEQLNAQYAMLRQSVTEKSEPLLRQFLAGVQGVESTQSTAYDTAVHACSY